VYRDLVERAATLGLADAFALLAIFNRLERVSDQAKNISEETLFEVTGEQKTPTRYRVLFVDDDGSCLAPLATALAKKAFPESGEYAAAGLELASVAPVLTALGERLGLDLAASSPSAFPVDPSALEGLHVVVALSRSTGARLQRLPYATSLVQWDLPQSPATDSEALTDLSRRIAGRVGELMTLLRGSDAP
jgi:hypothetical protein